MIILRMPPFLAHRQEGRLENIHKGLVHTIEILIERAKFTDEIGKEYQVENRALLLAESFV